MTYASLQGLWEARTLLQNSFLRLIRSLPPPLNIQLVQTERWMKKIIRKGDRLM